MTPVQASVIPLFMTNKDVVVEAVTGSGKSLAFLVPVIERVLKLDAVRPGHFNALIISPTRELAQQIHSVLDSLLKFAPGAGAGEAVPVEAVGPSDSKALIRTQLLIGGSTATHENIQTFLSLKPQILVATPGRLLEFLGSAQVHCSSVECLVLDEADRLLDLGFDASVNKSIAMLPKQKRVGLFSATISDSVNQLVSVGLRYPIKIVVKVGSGDQEQKVPSTLKLSYAIVDPAQKVPLLVNFLKTCGYNKIIVFFPTCTSVTYFYTMLKHLMDQEANTTADGQLLPTLLSLHGKLPPDPRKRTLHKFTTAVTPSVLLTTDVASRGLDIPEVDLVIQLDPPSDPNVFLHRFGRAARAGRAGQGVVMLNNGREADYVQFMQIRKVRMDPYALPELPDYTQELRSWILKDRGRHDLAIRAFLSFVRFYAKHTATSIFRVHSLDFVAIAKSYGLLRLPKMPELKDRTDMPRDGWLGDQVDMDSYVYLDPQREQARLVQLQKQKEEQRPKESKESKPKELKSKKSNEAWSAKTERKDIAAQRRTKRKARSQAKHQQETVDSDSDAIQEDWKDIIQKKKRKQQDVVVFDDL